MNNPGSLSSPWGWERLTRTWPNLRYPSGGNLPGFDVPRVHPNISAVAGIRPNAAKHKQAPDEFGREMCSRPRAAITGVVSRNTRTVYF